MGSVEILIASDQPMSPSGSGPNSRAADQPVGMGPRTPSVPAAKIMIIDDEPLNIRVVRKYLTDEGYSRFVEATDAVQAVAFAARERPDLILLDIVMPRLSGLDVLDTLRHDSELGGIPVIILTASADRETRLEALRGGATDFLHKPVDPSELIAGGKRLAGQGPSGPRAGLCPLSGGGRPCAHGGDRIISTGRHPLPGAGRGVSRR